MIVAAMLDAGVETGWLIEQIDSLAIDGLQVETVVLCKLLIFWRDDG